ncbi:AGBL2 [Branchiostoma lanceolatum]|uniref:AGBL2 protein n=1 Tax=Branchiostoma lanceolatum TaxID=7740 RepID=A0A8J9ZP92_BRALA|nr:AGBL2 [Branchiostoma lanceolatum]
MSFSLKPDPEFEFGVNSYDAFMKKHLQHYGYYTGRNEGYRSSFSAFEQWQRTRGYRGGYSDHDAMDVDEEDEYENHALVKTVKRSNSVDNRLCDDLLRKTTQIVFHYQHGKRVPKLREPRNLYALTKEMGPQQAPRFPAEMPVLKTRMKHIEWTPPFREPFYVQTNQERTPMVRGIEGEGRVVYFCETLREAYFMRSRVGGSRGPLKDITVKLKDENDKTLIFESRFESGNLMKVVQVGEFEYELYLRQDLYTDKHTQWYYFRVQNARKGHTYRFTIVNLLKGGSLYNMGLKPLMYSEQDAQTKKTGWLRVGENIKYYKNNVRINLRSDKCYYSLTWTCSYPNDNDSYFFSHCYPYTYSDLQDYLLKMANDPVRSKYCRQRVLCRTLAGNLVYVLTITNPSKNPEDAKVKKAVVLSARVHPGETNASWMMKGFLDYLSGNSADAKLLRDTFIFKIVPMLNPDGVIVGNYRCSLAGRDLNRNYKSVLKESFPSVWHTKMMVRRLCEEREVIVYCDLHGHSRKQNVFIYGCENRYDPEKRLKERVFPLMMQKNAGEKFSYNGCKFKVQKSKDGTGRIVMWHTGIMNAYTMEATFAGSTRGKMKGYHFNTADFEAMGYHFCDTLLDYCDPDRSKANQVMQELQDKLRQEILRRIELSGKAPPVGDPLELEAEFGSDLESDTSGSDSSVDDGLPVHLLAIAPKLNRKKKLRSRKERNKNRNKEIKTKPSKSEDNKEQSEEKKKPKPQSADKRPIRTQHSDVHSARKRRDDRSNNGIPVFADERVELRSARKTDYLEAITQAYLRSGVMLSNEQAKEVPHFRYASGQKHLIEGLCPQHDQNFAANYVANHLSDNYSEEPVEPMEVEKRHKEDPNKRLMSQKHLVELSAKVQRQHEQSIQAQRDRRTHRAQSPIKQHPSPFDEGHSKAASRIGSSIDREARSRVGSATIVSVQSRAPTAQSRVSSGVARVAERIGSATYSMPKGSQVFTGAQIIPRARNAEESSDSSDTHIKSFKAETKQYTVPSSTAITEVTRQGTPAAYPPRAPDKDPVTMTTVPGFASIPVKKVMPKDMKPEPKPTPSKPPARPAANSPDPSSALANIGDLRKSLVEPPDRAKVPPEKTSRRETYVRELHARHPDSDNTATNQEAEEREEVDRTGDKSPDFDPAHQNLEWRHRDPRHRPMPEFIPVAMEKISMKDLEMAPRNAPPRERPSTQQYLPQQYALERPQAQSREENPKVHSFGVGKMAGPFSREKQPAASASKQLTSSFQDIVCRRDREGAGAMDDTDEQQESRENSGSSQEGRKLETTIERASTVPVRQSEPNIYYGRLASPSRTWRMPTMFDHLQPGKVSYLHT